MANKITQEQIIEMNRAYLRIKTYAGVAREVGVSPGTVKKYIIPDFVDPDLIEVVKFDKEVLPVSEIEVPEDWGDWCLLQGKEVNKIMDLWKEMTI